MHYPLKTQEITSDILSRVFLIKYQNTFGSSFTIEVDGRQYLLTARHIVNGIKDGDKIEILQNDGWKEITVKPLYIDLAEIDIVVLIPPSQLSPAWPLEPSVERLILGQKVYFLGFPFGLRMEGRPLNYPSPIPFVKSGICSAIISPRVFLDAFNNPGFSGGPIVFVDQYTRKLKVCGVVEGFRFQEDKVFRKVPKKNKKPGEEDDLVETDMVTQSNTGIVIGFNIKSAIDVILKNPIGPQIKKEKTD